MKNIFSKTLIGAAALLLGLSSVACSDANEYEDVNTDNPAFTAGDSVAHPTSLANSKYVRATGFKVNAFGEDVQGFVESLDFVAADSVAVVMSQGATEGTWVDDSNTDRVPLYEYEYSDVTGKFDIKKRVVDDKGKVSKVVIFSGMANTGSRDIITIVHFNDIPSQTYLVKQ